MHRPPSSWKGHNKFPEQQCGSSSTTAFPGVTPQAFASPCSYSAQNVAVSQQTECCTARESRAGDGGRQGGGFVAPRDTAATCRTVSPACQLWRYFGEHRRSLQLLPRQPLEAARKEINSLSLLEDGASTKCILPSQPSGEWMLTLDLDPQESGSELRTLHVDWRSNTWFRGTSQRATLAEIPKPAWSWLWCWEQTHCGVCSQTFEVSWRAALTGGILLPYLSL